MPASPTRSRHAVACAIRAARRSTTLALLLFAAGAAGCASGGTIDLVEACPRTSFRTEGPVLSAAAVHLRLDGRPLIEHGKDTYLGESRVEEQRFKTPVAESVLAVVARDLKDSGLFRAATYRRSGLPFRVDLDLLHAYAAVDSGLTALVPILPTSSLEAVVDLRVVFTDEDGRVFLDERFVARKSGSAALVQGGEAPAAALFALALRDAVDQALRRMASAHAAFWSQYPAASRRS
jgi:hypothetical protein